MAVSFKTDAIDCAIDLGSAEDLIDLICYRSLKRDVNVLANVLPLSKGTPQAGRATKSTRGKRPSPAAACCTAP